MKQAKQHTLVYHQYQRPN